jgi:hypothetical protein
LAYREIKHGSVLEKKSTNWWNKNLPSIGIMAKTKLEFVCRECGSTHPQWAGPKVRSSSLNPVVNLTVFSDLMSDNFCTFSFGHCVVYSSSKYGFWLPLWYLQTLLHCIRFVCLYSYFTYFTYLILLKFRRGHDSMVVAFTTTYAISAHHH